MTTRTRCRPRALLLLSLSSLLTVPILMAQPPSAGSPQSAAIVASGLAAEPVAYPVAQIDPQMPAQSRGSSALWESLQRLHTTASLLMMTAHPDDEDGGMLAFESRGVGARTGLFTLTRGEGGQNAMSAADYEALGLIRTEELLRADRYYGVVTPAANGQYWGTVADYGFSKTIEEALSQWGHDRVLYDAVRAVRMYRPMVICSVFVGGVTDGHGHHQVAGMLAQEAFKMAGDPKVFPDQIAAGLLPWQPHKVYERVPSFSISPKGMYDYATGKWAPVRFWDYVHDTWIEGAPAANVEVPEGTRDPLIGESYIQLGRRGLGEQKTQHEGPLLPLPGTVVSGYHRYGAALAGGAQPSVHEQSFFDGVDTTLPGIVAGVQGNTAFMKQHLIRIQDLVNTAMLNYSPRAPEKIAPMLADGRKQAAALLAQVETSTLSAEDKGNLRFELETKLAQFNAALAQALGLEIAALVQPQAVHTGIDPYAAAPSKALPLTPEESAQSITPGSEFRVRVHVTTPPDVSLTKVQLQTPEGERWQVTRLGAPGIDDPSSQSGDVVFGVAAPKEAQPTKPYFSRPSTEQPYYDIQDPRWRNLSSAPYPLTGVAEYSYHGVPVRVAQTVQTMHRVVGLGAVYAPLIVNPEISITMGQHAGIVPLDGGGGHPFTMPVRVHSNEPGLAEGTLHLALPEGWQAEPQTAAFHLREGDDETLSFCVTPSQLTGQEYTVKAIAESGGYSYSDGYESPGYAGLSAMHLFRPAAYRVRGVDVKVAPDLNVGYVMGTGDDVPSALEELGIHPHLLTAAELLSGDLSRYQTIVLGIRAYAARPELATASSRLLAYVHDGGNVVVQYMGPEYDHDYGPFPYVLGGGPEKVVDEHALVTLLEPSHPLLTWPNRITAADFDGWLEERGHSFMKSWSQHYMALTETHDPEQDPQQGGLLFARYGKGTYTYVAFALYRQTPEGVPGAFRILANLVSAGRNTGTAPIRGR